MVFLLLKVWIVLMDLFVIILILRLFWMVLLILMVGLMIEFIEILVGVF